MEHLELVRNEMLLSPGFVIERRQGNSSWIDNTFNKEKTSTKWQCHYRGKLRGHRDSTVALSLCEGLTGIIRKGQDEYFIEPVLGHDVNKEPRHPHIIYKRSSLQGKIDNKHSSCGNKGNNIDTKMDPLEHHQSEEGDLGRPSSRHRRSVSYNSNVEVLVVADESMINHYYDQSVETYVLTIMNIVTGLYHDASLGNFVNVVMVKLLLLEHNPDDLVIMHHADKTLDSFCRWQMTINPEGEDHPNHHDVAVLLTRKDLCQGINEPCGTLGLAHVNGMCQPHRSCSVNEDTGLSLAYTVAHEMGHNFGMQHDGTGNDCDPSNSSDIHMMSPLLTMDSSPLTWSRCSREYITKFFDRGWGYCLQDEPSDHSYQYPLVPPGVMYDADHQCRLQYGVNASLCQALAGDICNTLWCRVGYMCHSKLSAAAKGTSCGKDKWCYNGECVNIAEPPQAINGDWGPWGEWSDCSRSCGGGVSIKERLCNNPSPSKGGKYCVGERKKYAICNREACPQGVPDIRSMQCTSFNDIPYDGNFFTWMPYVDKESPCELHCRPEDNYFAAKLANNVINGTPCGKGTRDICIDGVCQHVGCDYRINSDAIEDRCGVCHGDGRSCEMVKAKFTKESGIGYVEANVIPVGARNIRVEEVAAANNYLALMDNRGQYILNGNWYIQWSGEYEAAGTTVNYQRVENKETVFSQGPLQEPLHVMLLFQSPNPGVVFEYTVPKPDNETLERIQEFSWEFGDWSPCSVTCGVGTQRSAVHCVETIAGVVEDKYCNITKPDDKQRTCNEHQCPATWWIGPWQHCSVSCGQDGERQRSVFCIRGVGKDEQVALTEQDCLDHGLDKPETLESCNRHIPCPTRSDWIAGNWTECSSTCGRGIQHRIVHCRRDDALCDFALRPLSEQICIGVCDGDHELIAADHFDNKNPQYQADYFFSYQDTWSTIDDSVSDTDFNDQRHRQIPISFGEWEKMKAERAGIFSRSRLLNTMMRNSWLDSVRNDQGDFQDEFASDAYDSSVGIDKDTQSDDYDINTADSMHSNHRDLILDMDKPQIDPDDFILNDDIRRPTEETYLLDNMQDPSSRSVTASPFSTLLSTTRTDPVQTLLNRIQSTQATTTEKYSTTDASRIQYEWIASHWTPCSATCGTGYQARRVYCLDTKLSQPVEYGCDESNKPDQISTCVLPDCPQQMTTQQETTTIEPTTMPRIVPSSANCMDLLGATLCNAVLQASKCGDYDYYRYCCATCYYDRLRHKHDR
ncbi:A disintegrin and metalloproteinase with thrombospondin motifs 7-like [Amphiura filiformis]|uniref:A disintegrin and metalloproteinase with thrombospondin motifs 7-like n=1 Tax=Amphiura filiformis TaxID=82378 RepID=UPI003B21636E